VKTNPIRRRKGSAAGPGLPLVVCVDDEPHILAALARTLRGEPYAFWTTADPQEALEWVKARDVAVLIADFRMPGMSGTTLLQLAKERSPRTARLLLTGYLGEGAVPAAGEAEPLERVGKPWDDERLKRTIRDRLAGREGTPGPRGRGPLDNPAVR
jgi:DNA-binding NtrC family response regulator